MAQGLCGKELELSIKHFPSSDPSGGRRLRLSERDLFKLLWDGIRAQEIPFARDIWSKLFAPNSFGDSDYLEWNFYLGNGARFYLDSGWHPEICTPECQSVADVVMYESSLSDLLEEALYSATSRMHQGGLSGKIELHKNNMDAFGDSWGCHWNILSERTPHGRNEHTFLRELIQFLVPFFATSIIYTGAGTAVTDSGKLRWCISQRALFMKEEVGNATESTRNLFNLRDEPLADRERYRRLHLISPDHNMSEFAAYLGLSLAQMLVRVVEKGTVGFTPGNEGCPSFFLSLISDPNIPHAALITQEISEDPNYLFELRNGNKMTALEHQWGYYKLLRQNYEEGIFKDDPEAEYKLSCFELVLRSLQDHTTFAEQRIDYLIKRRALEEWMSEQQQALAKRHHNFGKVKIYDWQALAAWKPVLDQLRELRVYGDLKQANPKSSQEVMDFLKNILGPSKTFAYANLERNVRSLGLRMVYYSQAWKACHELLAKDVSYHSLKRHPHLWPGEDIGLFHALRRQGRVPPAYELLPFFPNFHPGETLDEQVEQELRKRFRQAPPGRAATRGALITKRYSLGDVAFANWCNVVYQDGPQYRRITMNDPFS